MGRTKKGDERKEKRNTVGEGEGSKVHYIEYKVNVLT